MKNLSAADHLKGNTAFKMMSWDYSEEVKRDDGLSSMEAELEKLWFENA